MLDGVLQAAARGDQAQTAALSQQAAAEYSRMADLGHTMAADINDAERRAAVEQNCADLKQRVSGARRRLAL